MAKLPQLGSVVEIYWTEEKQWYPGVVVAADSAEQCFSIMYEDEPQLFVHSVDKKFLGVKWAMVKDKKTIKRVNKKYQAVLNSRSHLAREINELMSLLPKTKRKSAQDASAVERKRPNDQQKILIKKCKTKNNSAVKSPLLKTKNCAEEEHTELLARSKENCSKVSEGIRDANITLSLSSDSDSSTSVSPTATQRKIEAHLTPLISKIRMRQLELTTNKDAQKISNDTVDGQDSGSEAILPVAAEGKGDVKSDTERIVERHSIGESSRLVQKSKKKSGSQIENLTRSSDSVGQQVTPSLPHNLVFRSPKKRKKPSGSAPVYDIGISSPGFSSSRLPNGRSKRFVPFSSPLKPERLSKSFVKRSHQLGTVDHLAQPSFKLNTTALLNHAANVPSAKPYSEESVDIDSQSGEPTIKRSRSVSFDSYLEQPTLSKMLPFYSPIKQDNASHISLPGVPSIDTLPLQLDPSSMLGTDGFAHIPASQSPFKKNQPLVQSQLDKRNDSADLDRMFPVINAKVLDMPPLSIQTELQNIAGSDLDNGNLDTSFVKLSAKPKLIITDNFSGLDDEIGHISGIEADTDAPFTPRTVEFRNSLIHW